jgi:hypothetical protein
MLKPDKTLLAVCPVLLVHRQLFKLVPVYRPDFNRPEIFNTIGDVAQDLLHWVLSESGGGTLGPACVRDPDIYGRALQLLVCLQARHMYSHHHHAASHTHHHRRHLHRHDRHFGDGRFLWTKTGNDREPEDGEEDEGVYGEKNEYRQRAGGSYGLALIPESSHGSMHKNWSAGKSWTAETLVGNSREVLRWRPYDVSAMLSHMILLAELGHSRDEAFAVSCYIESILGSPHHPFPPLRWGSALLHLGIQP